MKNNSKERDNPIFSQLFRTLVETGSDLIGIIDDEGNYLFVSPSCEHILGYTAEYFIGRNAFEFIHPDDAPKALLALNNLKNHKTVYLNAFRFMRSDGEWRWIETVATNELENSLINGIVVNSRDITDRKLSEQRLHLQNLNQQEEMQRKITEAVILAQEQERNIISQELHDNVCQLLSTAKLYVDLIKGQNEEINPLINDTLEIIKLSIQQVREISHALSFSSLEDSPIYESVEELIKHVNGALKTEFAFEVEQVEDKRLSFGMKLSIYRIIQEQVNNILKHSNAKNALVRLAQSGNRFHLEIKDNGIGFNISDRKKGVGLKNIKSRVDAYRGKLDLQTSPGKGCILKIEFNLCDSVSSDQ